MHKDLFPRILLFSSLCVVISACAKVSSPSGGKRDKTPPAALSSVPENYSINFRGKKVSVTFDEFVVLDNINDKFMVSPPMKKKPRVFIKGKSVNVEFDEKLKDSTTYTFYFQDAIKDLNEGNILDNFQFVFSTGQVIDSLSVTGNVYNADNLEVPEKTQVLMYRELADSAVVKHLPDYIARVDPTGYYRFNNVRSGMYRLYALKDNDNSKNYNFVEEEFAFLNSPVIISAEKNFLPVVKDTTSLKSIVGKATEKAAINKTVSKAPASANAKKVPEKAPEPEILSGEYKLMLFMAKKKNHYLTGSSRDLKYRMTYTLSLPPDTMKLEFSIPDAAKDAYFIEESKSRDTLTVWLTDSTLYSKAQIPVIIRYPFTDTLKRLGYKQDTITMRFTVPRAPRVVKVKKPVFSLETNINSGFLKPGQRIILKSPTPFKDSDTSRIRIYEIIDSTRKIIPSRLVKDVTNSCRYFVTASFSQGKKYFFLADSASFTNYYYEYSDSTGIKFSISEPESYGKLTFLVSNYEGDRIIQLLNKAEILIGEIAMKKDGKAVFPYLDAGGYRARVIYDLNSDGKWTTGDFDTGLQPEPVSYLPKEIELTKGWESDEDWDIGIKNIKEQKLRQKIKNK